MSPPPKLADSLEALHELQRQGVVAIRSRDLSRTHRERLLANGFLREVIKDCRAGRLAAVFAGGRARRGFRGFLPALPDRRARRHGRDQ